MVRSPEPPLPDAPIALRMRVGCEAIRAAGALAWAEFCDRGGLEARLQGPQDWSSSADRKVEALLRSRLSTAFPADHVLGEEGGGRFCGDVWVVDPIDGTANFVRGSPLWCLSVAYVAGGITRFGLVYHPATDELFTARRGRGASLNGKPVRVSGTQDPRHASLEIGWCWPQPLRRWQAAVEKVVSAGADFTRIGVGALTLAWVACGRLDGYADRSLKVWDGLAGWLLVREAGGAVTPYERGLQHDLSNHLIACTPALRPLLQECLEVL